MQCMRTACGEHPVYCTSTVAVELRSTEVPGLPNSTKPRKRLAFVSCAPCTLCTQAAHTGFPCAQAAQTLRHCSLFILNSSEYALHSASTTCLISLFKAEITLHIGPRFHSEQAFPYSHTFLPGLWASPELHALRRLFP